MLERLVEGGFGSLGAVFGRVDNTVRRLFFLVIVLFVVDFHCFDNFLLQVLRRLLHPLIEFYLPCEDLAHEYGLPFVLVVLVPGIYTLGTSFSMWFVFWGSTSPHNWNRYRNHGGSFGPQALHISHISGSEKLRRLVDMLLLEPLFSIILGIERLSIKSHFLLEVLRIFGFVSRAWLPIVGKVHLELLLLVGMVLFVIHEVLLISRRLIVHLLHLIVERLLLGQDVALWRSLVLHLAVDRRKVLVVASGTTHLVILLRDLHRLDLGAVHIDVVQVGTASPRQHRIAAHLERLNGVFGLVNGIHHVLVDRAIYENVRPLVLMLHRVAIVGVLGILVRVVVPTMDLLLRRRSVL